MRTGKNTTTEYGSALISIVKDARKIETQNFNLEQIVTWIREGSGNFTKTISEVREAIDLGQYDRASELKLALPAVMFSGTFSKRSSKDLIDHSGIICMDFDGVESPENKVDSLRFDPHIIAAFVSPSRKGLKVLVAVPKDGEKHREAFDSAKRYLATYDLIADESGKDVSRLCFLSYDPEIHYAPDAVELPIYIVDQVEEIERQTKKTGDRIGDRYEQSSNVRERSVDCLHKLGWQIKRGDADRTYCTRPGKNAGVSGELRSDGSFFCYTDSASPLDPNQNYSAFSLYTYANHGGDFKEAAKDLSSEFGEETVQISGRDFFNKNPVLTQVNEDGEEETSIGGSIITKKDFEIISAFPEWTSASDTPKDLSKLIMQRYPVLIEGLLHRGTKMVLGGGSKSYKTWTLLNLALCVASGQRWFGNKCVDTGLDVVFLNFEVPHEFFLDRMRNVCRAMEIEEPENLKIWSMRGVCNDLRLSMLSLKERLTNGCSLICVDPIYKALGDRDENSAGDIGLLMNEVEAIVEQTGAAVAFGAHYSKGNQAEKDALDRISGSGVFARDPDTIMGLTAHEEENCFTVHSALRNFPGKDPFVVEWDFPLFKERDDLDAGKLKRPGQKTSNGQILKALAEKESGIKPADFIPEMASKFDISERSVYRLIKNLSDAGKINKTAGHLYATSNQ
jgi:hypothetical protein